jgi:REP element-mobilizing transposase RayT
VTLQVRTDTGVELHEFNGETDYVHLLVHYPPKIALSRVVNSLKGVSAPILLLNNTKDPARPTGRRSHSPGPSPVPAS